MTGYKTGRSPVAEALRHTRKGQQKYDPYWHDEGRIKEILDECASSSPISVPAGLDLSTLSISPANKSVDTDSTNHKRTFLDGSIVADSKDNDYDQSSASCTRTSSKLTPRSRSNDSDSSKNCVKAKIVHREEDRSPPHSSVASPRSASSSGTARSPVVSPTLSRADIQLRIFNDDFVKKKQRTIDGKLEAKERDWRLIHQRAQEQALELSLHHDRNVKRQNQIMDEFDRRAKADLQKLQERQKEEQHKYRKILDAKYRAAEARKQELVRQEKEREEKRQQELAKKLTELQKYPALINKMKDEAEKSISEFTYKQYLPDMATKGVELLKMITSQSVTVLEKTRTDGVVENWDEIEAVFTNLVKNAESAKKFIQTAFEYARKAGEEEEAAKKKVAEASSVPADINVAGITTDPVGVSVESPRADADPDQSSGETEVECVSEDAFIAYTARAQLLEKVQALVKPLVETQDKNMKKYKNDLTKSVSTPVNAISSRSGDDLKDKLKRLHNILKGDYVEVSGKKVSVRDNKLALSFVKNILASKLASQGDEPVSSKHEAAFPIAAIIVAVWCTVPDVGELLLANLQKVCPYIVPYYIPQKEGQSMEEYNKCLGYKYRDGKPEEQDKFLSRMSGYMRLYASVMVTETPPGVSAPHPHGLPHAWQWLTRLVNLPPHPDITATLLYDMLQVTGHYLDKAYTKQFSKLLNVILTVFLPKIRKVTVEGRMGPVTRLELALEKWLKDRRIPAPEGVITSRFWFSKDSSSGYYY